LSQPSQTSKSKDLKVVTRQVINPSVIKEDKRKLQLLYIIKTLNSVSEKALTQFLYEAKDKGFNMGYPFSVIGGNVVSQQLKDDITSLLYLGLIENDPGNKKLKLTMSGEETVEGNMSLIDDAFKNSLTQALNELKNKIVAIDEEYSLKLRSERRGRRR